MGGGSQYFCIPQRPAEANSVDSKGSMGLATLLLCSRVWGVGFWGWGLGLLFGGLGFRILGLGFRVKGIKMPCFFKGL